MASSLNKPNGVYSLTALSRRQYGELRGDYWGQWADDLGFILVEPFRRSGGEGLAEDLVLIIPLEML